jgi:hypothetical protein
MSSAYQTNDYDYDDNNNNNNYDNNYNFCVLKVFRPWTFQKNPWRMQSVFKNEWLYILIGDM